MKERENRKLWNPIQNHGVESLDKKTEMQGSMVLVDKRDVVVIYGSRLWTGVKCEMKDRAQRMAWMYYCVAESEW